jgi:hypothetical protein
MSEKLFIDMSNPAERNTLWQSLRNLKGLYRIEITRDRKLRTSAQNRLYFGVYVNALRLHLAAQGEPKTADFCHKMLAQKFLLETLFHPVTGEVIGEAPRSTADLTTKEFSDYLDNIQQYLAEEFGIELPSIYEFTGTTREAEHVNHG